MSATNPPAGYTERLDLAGVVGRIERQQAETRKFVEEKEKLAAERDKLNAAALKLARGRWLAPWVAVVALVGGVGGTLAGVATLVRLLRGAGP